MYATYIYCVRRGSVYVHVYIAPSCHKGFGYDLGPYTHNFWEGEGGHAMDILCLWWHILLGSLPEPIYYT